MHKKYLWITLDNGKHIFIKDTKGGSRGSNNNNNNSSNNCSSTRKTKGASTGFASSVPNNKTDEHVQLEGHIQLNNYDNDNSNNSDKNIVPVQNKQQENKQEIKPSTPASNNKTKDTNIEKNSTINYALSKIVNPIQKELGDAKAKQRKKFENSVAIWEERIQQNINRPTISKPVASIYARQPDAVGMINIASGKEVPNYTKNALRVENIKDESVDSFNNGDLKKWKPYMQWKIEKQFKDFNYSINDVKGFIFKSNSAISKRIMKSSDFKETVKRNKQAIFNGERFSAEFLNDKNLHNAFHYYDILNSGFDKNGDLHLYVFDTYDFNKNETNPKVQAGRRQMQKGNLKGFFTICEIVIKKNELHEYNFD